MFSESSLMTRQGVRAGDRLDTPVRDAMRRRVIVTADDASTHGGQRARVAHGAHSVLVLDDGAAGRHGWITTRGRLRRQSGLREANVRGSDLLRFVAPSAETVR
jgi:hypothetical protein